MWDGRLGRIKKAKHQRNLMSKNTNPFDSALYCSGTTAWQSLSQVVQKTLQEEVIWPVNTEWASPIVFSPEKNGSIIACVDRYSLNPVMARELDPLQDWAIVSIMLENPRSSQG